ncbi:MAG TPA: CAP domain-containing protein [Alphaproteobacteria bacterium]|nr:CAP domain-containing protein [Alphaproteobacteria bacterium]
MKTIAKLFAALACLIAALVLPQTLPAAQPDPMMASRVIQLVNQARQQSGLPPVAMDQKLMQAAQALADDLARRRTLSHMDSSGNGIGQRFLAVDYVYALADEALGGGQPTPETLVAALLAQPDNRDTLLNPDVRDAGVGYVFRPDEMGGIGLGTYWVIDLGLQVERGPWP